jgi:hypothetical protein
MAFVVGAVQQLGALCDYLCTLRSLGKLLQYSGVSHLVGSSSESISITRNIEMIRVASQSSKLEIHKVYLCPAKLPASSFNDWGVFLGSMVRLVQSRSCHQVPVNGRLEDGHFVVST